MPTQTLNSLSRASSAYLRSAMHQPIQWHEWSAEAFDKAKLENKPATGTAAHSLSSIVPRTNPKVDKYVAS